MLRLQENVQFLCFQLPKGLFTLTCRKKPQPQKQVGSLTSPLDQSSTRQCAAESLITTPPW